MADNVTIKNAAGADVITKTTEGVGSVHTSHVNVDSLPTGTNNIAGGTVAHDAAGATINPVAIGGYAASTVPSPVSADNDVVRASFSRYGAQRVQLSINNIDIGGDSNGLDVDVTRVIPGTTATALGKAEDAAHANGDVGVMALGVRRDANTSLVSADGDYAPFQVNATGALKAADAAVLASIGATNAAAAADSTSDAALIGLTKALLREAMRTDPVAVVDGASALTPKFAVIDAATSGNNTIVAAVSGKKIRVLSCYFTVADEVMTRFESGANGTALTGQSEWDGKGRGLVLPRNPDGWFETAAGALLNLELSAAVSVDGALVYVEV